MGYPRRVTPTTRWLRLSLLLIGAAFLLHGPVLTQLLGFSRGPATRYWRMYSGHGLKVCDVRFEQVRGGQQTPVDRFALLGHEDRARAPTRIRRMANRKEVDAMGKALCARLPRGVALHVTARCASRQGWRPLYDGAEPLCEGGQ